MPDVTHLRADENEEFASPVQGHDLLRAKRTASFAHPSGSWSSSSLSRRAEAPWAERPSLWL